MREWRVRILEKIERMEEHGRVEVTLQQGEDTAGGVG